MKFYIDRNSSIPVSTQIQEQIKLALAMGIIRKGDTLPSIRDVEKQTGINRNQIHRAYLDLKRSGLLALKRGKGTVVSSTVDAPVAANEKCLKLCAQITHKVQRMGISPMAFARYLNQYAQNHERNSPYLWYVDLDKEIARQIAAEISRLWQVPIKGIAVKELKTMVRMEGTFHKVLVNDHLYEIVRSMFPKKKLQIIRIEERAWIEDGGLFKDLKENSSVLFLHLPQGRYRVNFIVTHLKEILSPRRINIDSAPVRDAEAFRKLIKNSRYDYFIVGPAARGMIPPELQQDPRILPIRPRLDPFSLEAARIRAGVIV